MRPPNIVSAIFAAFFWTTTLGQQPTALPGVLDDMGSGIALRRMPRQRLYGRDLLNKRMMPERTIDLDFLHSKGAISTFSLSHNHSHYVNLENYHMHGLIEDVPLCRKPDRKNRTVLMIPFADYSAFRFAKEHWKKTSNLLFVIEDPSCEAGAHERSIYKPLSIDFLEGPGFPIAVRITATYEGVGWHGNTAASDITFTLNSIERFREHHGNSFDPVQRTNGKDCTDDLLSCVSSVASSFIEDIEELFEPIKNLGDQDHEMSWGIHADKNREGKQCIEPAKGFQDMRWLPQFAFINTHFSMDFDVYFRLKFKIIDKDIFDGLVGSTVKDKFADFVGHHFEEGTIGVKATKEFTVGFQTQIKLQAGYEYFCLTILWPYYQPIECSPAVVFGVIAYGEPTQWDNNKFTKQMEPESEGFSSFEKFGLKFMPSAGIGMWFRLGTFADVSFTTPGFDLSIPKDSYAEIGFKGAKPVYENTMHANLKWRAPQINITEAKVYASVSIGPRVSLTMPMGEYSLGMSARIDLPRLQVTAGKAHDVDENCKKEGANRMKDAMGVWLDASIQPYATITLPFVGPILDSDWIGKAIWKDWKGFLWKKTLVGICRENTKLDSQSWLEPLNRKFQKIAASNSQTETKEQRDEYDDFMPEWQGWKDKHPHNETVRPANVPAPDCLNPAKFRFN